ncbi:YesL family protein [Bacillus solitudinis]|uniref:YesL family protein n=1 Tax=Bacillus solitudinis TaxID=2014074 RepID=UPI000C23BCA3|nr:DUF624 domain-containing protein [Bacillus solitudinis]
MKNLSEWYIRLGVWGLNLFLLNLFWFLFSIVGLFVFGVFPATVALFTVMRTLVMEKEEIPLFKLFWRTYKSEFLNSNLIGYLISLFGFILYIDLRVLQQLDNSLLHLSLTIMTFVIIFVYFLTLLYLFPVLVHFDLKTFQYFKYALILAIGRPFQTLFMIVALAILAFFFMQVPGLIPVFGVSLISLTIMKISSLSFIKKDITSISSPNLTS